MKTNYFGLKKLTVKAILNGAKSVDSSRTHFKWDISGDCLNPYIVHRSAMPDIMDKSKDRFQDGKRSIPIALDICTRCRHCPHCLSHRAKLWFARTRCELIVSRRSWFGTLTLSDENQMYFLSRARLASTKNGIDLDTCKFDYKFKKVIKEITPEITKWFKKVRKRAGCKLRYCLVSEPHKSGYPHFHVLIHEVDGVGVVTHRNLSEPWDLGFTNFKLVDSPSVAGYISKYLTKSLTTRVRASIKYGNYNYPLQVESDSDKIVLLTKCMTEEEM